MNTKKIYYEDYLEDPRNFIERFCAEIGVDPPPESEQAIRFEKLIRKPAFERLAAPANMPRRPDIRLMVMLYRFATAP